jgi:N-acetylneuraminate synthase/N,N'-diacetyllegionaminate synthase
MEFKIQNKMVGDGHPVFFIAEAGVNHNGSIGIGKKLIDKAVESCADAVKFQTFKTENIITPGAPKATYHVETTGGDKEQSWFELLKTQEMSRDMHVELIEYCNQKEIIFLSTPYDEESVDLLVELNVPAFKIASTDTSNIPLLSYIAQKGHPMIISTAMATMEEVEEAVKTIREQGMEDFAVLQCTGNYPSQLEDSNLQVLQTYREKLKCIIGYSDHTEELINPVAATAMGAKIYEKHFTLDKSLPGPDHRMSLEPAELKKTVQAIRDVEKAIGSADKQVLEVERENRKKLRKSIVANTEIKQGAIIIKEMIAIKRPGIGIPPGLFESILGRKAKVDIPAGTVMNLEMVNGE